MFVIRFSNNRREPKKLTRDVYKLSGFWDFPNLKELKANNKFYNTLLLLSNLTTKIILKINKNIELSSNIKKIK